MATESLQESSIESRHKTAYELLPFLSAADPEGESEGSLDPLGLYPIADALALRLAPGLRERQKNPRFLTLAAVSASICAYFQDDELSADGVSEPWQVFEWYVVEGLVRKAAADEELRALPGIQKARNARRDGLPLSARRYLKTPSVFGFHGVYRVLARELDIERDGYLGESGYELLKVWSREQGIPDFHRFAEAVAVTQTEYRTLVDAVHDGLEKGATSRRSDGWSGWQFIYDHLHPAKPGKQERAFLTAKIMGQEGTFRNQLFNFFISEPRGEAAEQFNERSFHAAFAKKASSELQALLATISSYEHFARLLQDAWDACLHSMTTSVRRLDIGKLSEEEAVKRAAKTIPGLFDQTLNLLQPQGEALRFASSFQQLSLPLDPIPFTEELISHHYRIQASKPPSGKSPWLERFDDGTYMVRAPYRREKVVECSSKYVHAYRAQTLLSFNSVLKLI